MQRIYTDDPLLKAIITSLDSVMPALEGKTGTVVVSEQNMT